MRKVIYLMVVVCCIQSTIHSQSIELIHELQVDSNEHISGFQIVNDGILFVKSTLFPPPFSYCGNSDKIYDSVSDVYSLSSEGNVSLLKKGRRSIDYDDYQRVTVNRAFNRGNFIRVNSDTDLFILDDPTNKYWIYSNKKFEVIELANEAKVSSYHPFEFDGRKMVYIRDTMISSQLSNFTPDFYDIEPFIEGKMQQFRMHNPTIYDSIMIFNAYYPAEKDHEILIANTSGEYRVITDFPRGVYHFNLQGKINDNVYFRFQHKGFADNYKNEFFNPTSFWKYNLKSNQLDSIGVMHNYGITNSNSEIGGLLYFLFGYHKYELYTINDAAVIKNISNSINRIDYFLPKGGVFKDLYYAVGVDFNKKKRIVIFEGQNMRSISPPIDSLINLSVTDEKIIILANQKGEGNKLLTYSGQETFKSLGIIDDEVKSVNTVYFDNDSLIIGNKQRSSILYKIEGDRAIPILNGIMHAGYSNRSSAKGYGYFKGKYYFMSYHDGTVKIHSLR